MSFLRNLWSDLVDKRLWPLALLLVAAAVAVPVVLHKDAKPVASAAATPGAGADAPAAASPVSLDQNQVKGAFKGGPLHDPFRQLHVPRASTATSTSTSGPATSSGSSSKPAGGSSGGSSSGSSGGGSVKPRPPTGVRLRVQFGLAGSRLRTYDLDALSALPSASNPVLVYLGLGKDGRTASFLVSSDATPQGDGRCSPSRGNCQTLFVQAGDSDFIDVTTDTGSVQYELDVKQVLR